jgi:polyisoprenoid-binding protein YceI
MRRRQTLLIALGAGLVLALAAFALVYFVLFPTSSPKRFAVTQPSAKATATLPPGAVAWKVAAGSQAGYRVREKLAFLPAKSDAVGRTRSITGSAQGDAKTISQASLKIIVATLMSDKSMRDQRIHTIGLQSDAYPLATFVLSKPVTLAKRAGATGKLTLHGVAKTVTIPLRLAVSGTSIEAVGSLTFPWSEFGMSAPSVAGFVTVQNEATMEFDLHLTRA